MSFLSITENPDTVPNFHPTLETPYRIAVVGDIPSYDDVNVKVPFQGEGGRLLNEGLNSASIARSACLLANVSNLRPRSGHTSGLSWDGDEIQDGMIQLRKDLNTFNPNITILLGELPLKAALDYSSSHPLVPNRFKHKVTNYCGSLFICEDPSSPFFRRKCIATYHPLKVLSQYENLVFLQFCCRRAREEAESPELILPTRRCVINLGAFDIINRLKDIKPGTLTSIDIEGGIVAEKKTRRKDPESGEYISEKQPSCVPCLAISTDPTEAFIINFGDHSEYEERIILDQLSRFCWDPTIPKLFQNGAYDTFVLWWMFKIFVRNHRDDTMISSWELNPELPKRLGLQAMLYTREPYWKADRKTDDPRVFLEYCCKDAAVTLEIHQRQIALMTPAQRKHYEFNCSLLRPLLYAELRGLRWDQEAADESKSRLQAYLAELWARIQTHAAKQGAKEHAKDKGVYCNPNSPKMMNEVMYDICGYTTQYKTVSGRKTNTKTCDKLALLTLLKLYPQDIFILDILQWRKHKKLLEQASTKTDEDGRIRCSYNQVGTTTGRLSSSAAPTGKGMNLQTVTKNMRHLIRADEGHEICQLDLEGADGWTVACACKALSGDDTMLEDYRFGIKPANVIALTYMVNDTVGKLELKDITDEFSTNLASWPREVLRDVAKEYIDKDGWLYFASKRVQHGGNYGLGKIQMSNQILQDSYKLAPSPILLPPKQCELLKRLYLGGRYMAVPVWQSWIKDTLIKTGILTDASGHSRRFFGRKRDNKTINAALSHAPQANTTYATNLALRNVWSDPDNRLPSGRLLVEPLHQVHDAIIVQWPIEKRAHAIKKLQSYMDNPIEIYGEKLTIPYEGEYGPSWGEMTTGTIYMPK